MAREPPEPDGKRSIADRRSSKPTGKSGLLHRRNYLKLAGAAAGAVAAAAGTVGTAAADDYNVITVGRNQRRTIRVESGETFENVLIDCTAPGAHVTFSAKGTNWTIRNVGVEGRLSHEEAFMGVADTGENTSTIENVYLGDGAEAGHRIGLGIWVAPAHSGHIDIERVNIQEMGDNSFYCSAPMYSGDGGTVDLRNCYSANSWVAHFRLGEGVVENCTAVNDGRHKDGRGIWAWSPGRVDVRDCNLAMNGRHYSIVAGANGKGSAVRVSGTQYDTGYNGGTRRSGGSSIDFRSGNGTNPADVVPEGCPTSPAEAAGGGAGQRPSDGPGADEPDGSRLEISGVGEYRVETDGEIAPAPALARWARSGTAYDNGDDGGYADWYLTGSETEWLVDGELTAIETDPYEGDLDLTFTLDGEEIDPAEYGNSGSDDDELDHLLLIDGSDDGVTRYEFEVDGVVEPSTFDGATIDDESRVADGVANGVVANWKDAWAFDGDLVELTVDGPGTVRLDGERVDPAEFGDDHPHALEIVGGGEPASFEVTVDGSVAYDGEAVNEVTTVSGTTVQSSVTDETLEVRYSGALTDVTFTSGQATVRLDGDAIDPDEYVDAELLPHAIVFDGTEASGPSTYSFAASGTVMESTYMGATPGEDDVVEDGTVRGGVDDWLDAYWFDGNLRDVNLSGDARVHLDYNARDQ